MMEVSQHDFESEVIAASHRLPVLVAFWAPGSAPCRAFAPVLEQLEDALAGQFKLVKVNAAESPQLAAALGVRSVPNGILFREGQPVGQFVGGQPEAALRAFLAPHVEKPGERERQTAREAMREKRHGIAAEALAVILAINPADQAARVDYVTALLRLGRIAQARTTFEPLAGRATTDPRLAAVARMLESAEQHGAMPAEAALRDRVASHPDDSGARLALADWLLARDRWAEAMDEMLFVVASDRAFGDDLARRSLLAAFDRCDDAALVATYRRRLGATLH